MDHGIAPGIFDMSAACDALVSRRGASTRAQRPSYLHCYNTRHHGAELLDAETRR
jgi:hypothetical protein